MPVEHIVSRIQSIESRITEIQKMGRTSPAKIDKTKTPTQEVSGDKFSDILNEVMRSREQSQLDILGDESTTNLADTRVDSLMELYKTTGAMPVAKPKPIASNAIISSNPRTWDSTIEQAAAFHDVDPRLVHAIIQTESAYNPNAISIAGAEGLMQLMPATAVRVGVKDSFDPAQNIFGGAQVLKEMMGRYDGNIIKALAAYNAGPEAVDKANGIPPYKETQAYVPKVLNYYYNLRHQ